MSGISNRYSPPPLRDKGYFKQADDYLRNNCKTDFVPIFEGRRKKEGVYLNEDYLLNRSTGGVAVDFGLKNSSESSSDNDNERETSIIKESINKKKRKIVNSSTKSSLSSDKRRRVVVSSDDEESSANEFEEKSKKKLVKDGGHTSSTDTDVPLDISETMERRSSAKENDEPFPYVKNYTNFQTPQPIANSFAEDSNFSFSTEDSSVVSAAFVKIVKSSPVVENSNKIQKITLKRVNKNNNSTGKPKNKNITPPQSPLKKLSSKIKKRNEIIHKSKNDIKKMKCNAAKNQISFKNYNKRIPQKPSSTVVQEETVSQVSLAASVFKF